ncbi:MAG TPA: TonB-dependent receptor, partial [Bacteroidia bacterium]|nr:TonB-dependent receptor [Bacteroidia bacterium]
LMEIKKIPRLSKVPVFMFSTSVDPAKIEEHKRLGAMDFIVKPSNIETLTSILTCILQARTLPVMILLYCLTLIPGKVLSQTDTISTATNLKKLSIEELMNIEVTSVSRTSEKLKDAASAIQVVSGEEIRRSGASRITGALRLAPNLQIAQSGSHDWGITARGFNGVPVTSSSLANKLLVLIDGRTVYTPLFGGVFWDVQNVLLEDVDIIEVISGPGGALWGANAVNGIINIKSKSAKETQGVYASGAYGSLLQDFGAVRYGSRIDSTLFFRVYGQRFDYNQTHNTDSTNMIKDYWYMNQGGFRMDYFPSKKCSVTFQGDVYGGEEDDSLSPLVNGQNLLARWNYSINTTSGLIVQVYYDRTFRNIQIQKLSDELSTFDIDVQLNALMFKKHKIVYGLGYRLVQDDLTFEADEFVPEDRTLNSWNGFIQDQISMFKDKIDITLGTKILHNDYSGFEFHPTVRVAWNISENQTLWTSYSRAVRTPTRFDRDNNGIILGSYGEFDSEKVHAYELGYRVRPWNNLSLSLATYYNRYTDLRSIDTNKTVTTPVFYFGNNLEASTYGFELSANFVATSWWKIRGGYTFLQKKYTFNSPYTYLHSDKFDALDPQNQFLLQSMVDIGKHFEVDAIVRYVDLVPGFETISSIPSYTTFDLRVAWNYKWVCISLTGQNLVSEYQKEFGTREIPRSIYAKATVKF